VKHGDFRARLSQKLGVLGSLVASVMEERIGRKMEWRDERDQGGRMPRGNEEERGRAPLFAKIPLPFYICSKLFNK